MALAGNFLPQQRFLEQQGESIYTEDYQKVITNLCNPHNYEVKLNEEQKQDMTVMMPNERDLLSLMISIEGNINYANIFTLLASKYVNRDPTAIFWIISRSYVVAIFYAALQIISPIWIVATSYNLLWYKFELVNPSGLSFLKLFFTCIIWFMRNPLRCSESHIMEVASYACVPGMNNQFAHSMAYFASFTEVFTLCIINCSAFVLIFAETATEIVIMTMVLIWLSNLSSIVITQDDRKFIKSKMTDGLERIIFENIRVHMKDDTVDQMKHEYDIWNMNEYQFPHAWKYNQLSRFFMVLLNQFYWVTLMVVSLCVFVMVPSQ